jgi:hypothetical protein
MKLDIFAITSPSFMKSLTHILLEGEVHSYYEEN